MKTKVNLILIATFFLSSAFTIHISQSWKIADDYNVKFSGRSAQGTFSGLQGDIIFDPNYLSTALLDVNVDVNTISTGNKTKDQHAKGESWFHAAKYSKIHFKSNSFEKTQDGYSVKGQLTLKGVEKEVAIPFKFENTMSGGMFSGDFKISRDAYGIKGPFFGFTVGDEFLIELRVPVE